MERRLRLGAPWAAAVETRPLPARPAAPPGSGVECPGDGRRVAVRCWKAAWSRVRRNFAPRLMAAAGTAFGALLGAPTARREASRERSLPEKLLEAVRILRWATKLS